MPAVLHVAFQGWERRCHLWLCSPSFCVLLKHQLAPPFDKVAKLLANFLGMMESPGVSDFSLLIQRMEQFSGKMSSESKNGKTLRFPVSVWLI